MIKKSAVLAFALLSFAIPMAQSMTQVSPTVVDLVVSPRLAPPAGTVRHNLSAEYLALMESASASPALFESLKRFKILIVPGFKNEWMGKNSGDFDDQIAVLKQGGLKDGVDFHKLDSHDGFGGLQEVQKNSKAIAAVIAKSERPVLLISQSKGSIDTLDALLAHPEVQTRVHSWFSIQGAFWGSQIADGIEAKSRDRFFFHEAMKILGGSAQTIIELQRSERLKYMRENSTRIGLLNRVVHVISWASYKDSKLIWQPLQKLDASYFPGVISVLSDGVIQLPDALLPDSDYAVAAGVDHADSTLTTVDQKKKKTDPPGFNRKQFMLAIATLITD